MSLGELKIPIHIIIMVVAQRQGSRNDLLGFCEFVPYKIESPDVACLWRTFLESGERQEEFAVPSVIKNFSFEVKVLNLSVAVSRSWQWKKPLDAIISLAVGVKRKLVLLLVRFWHKEKFISAIAPE